MASQTNSASAPTILVLNGPNLNLLGQREPEIYGSQTLADIEAALKAAAAEKGVNIDFRQSNVEGDLVNWIQEARNNCQGIIINSAAYTHTSVASLDALLNFEPPVIEVHLSNIFKRESFRHHSYISSAADGVICGLGANGYLLAFSAINDMISSS